METLWEKLLWWKKQKKLIENVDFRFVSFEESELTGIELLIPEFIGVVYHYGKVKFVEEGELGRLQFDYTVVSPGKYDFEDLINSEKFHIIMGDLLTQLLEENPKNEIRNNHS